MSADRFEVALFEADEAGGIRLVGRSTDPALIEDARARILAQRRAEVAGLERQSGFPPVRLVSPEVDPTEDSE